MRDIKYEELENYSYWLTNFDFDEGYNTPDFTEDYFSDDYMKIDTKLFLERLRDEEINSIFRDNGLYGNIPLGTKCAFLNTIELLYDLGTSENNTWISDEGLNYIKK